MIYAGKPSAECTLQEPNRACGPRLAARALVRVRKNGVIVAVQASTQSCSLNKMLSRWHLFYADMRVPYYMTSCYSFYFIGTAGCLA